MKGRYRAAVDRVSPPASVTLECITAERIDLYLQVPPPGDNIPISVESFQVEHLVPTEDEMEWAVRQLRNNRSGGPLGMRAEHLKRWLAEARKEDAAEGAEEAAIGAALKKVVVKGRYRAAVDRVSPPASVPSSV